MTTFANPLTVLPRRAPKAKWLEIDPVPVESELCVETDTRSAKIGDGISRYSQLPYAPPLPPVLVIRGSVPLRILTYGTEP